MRVTFSLLVGSLLTLSSACNDVAEPPEEDLSDEVSTAVSGTHTRWYVAPSGSSGAAGTASAPWSLAYALSGAGGKIHPGDTVWLRGGNYGTARRGSGLAGTAAAPIIVRQYPGERATIGGPMEIGGHDTWYWGFEVRNSNAGIGEATGVSVRAPRTKLINLVVHGWTQNGIGFWNETSDGEITGTLVYNNGWKASAGCKYGHGIYMQNQTGGKLLKDNVIFDQFAFGVHAYTAGGGLRNFTLEGNALFNNGASGICGTNVLIGGDAPVQNMNFHHNYVYQGSSGTHGAPWFGYNNVSTASRVTDNIIAGSFLRLFNWSSSSGSLQVERNQVSGGRMIDETGSWAGMYFANNRWYGSGGGDFLSRGIPWTFSKWRANTGKGATDTYTAGQPSGLRVIVRPNPYERGRANVIVYNWSGAGSVTVSVPGLTSGRAYEVLNAQRFWDAPVTTGSYGGSITIPLRAVNPYPAFIGWPDGTPTTGTKFQVFVVRPKG